MSSYSRSWNTGIFDTSSVTSGSAENITWDPIKELRVGSLAFSAASRMKSFVIYL